MWFGGMRTILPLTPHNLRAMKMLTMGLKCFTVMPESRLPAPTSPKFRITDSCRGACSCLCASCLCARARGHGQAAARAGPHLQRFHQQGPCDILRWARARGLQCIVPDDLDHKVPVLEAHHGFQQPRTRNWHIVMGARCPERASALVIWGLWFVVACVEGAAGSQWMMCAREPSGPGSSTAFIKLFSPQQSLWRARRARDRRVPCPTSAGPWCLTGQG